MERTTENPPRAEEHAAPDEPARLPGVLGLGALALLALLALLPSALDAQFLNFDDDLYFGAQNAAFRHGGLGHVLDPNRTIANAYLPVSHLSLYIDWTLFGGDPLGAHLHSLALHVLVAFMLARLFGLCGAGRWAAVAGAGLFLVHPALCESSMWVSGRKDLLSGLFSVLCLTAIARHGRGELRTGKAAVLAALWTLLALYAKASAAVLPLCAAVVVVLLRRPGRRGRFVPAAAVLAVSIPVGLHHALVAAAQGTLVDHGLGARLAQVPGAFLHYLVTALWPTGLNVLYPEVQTMARFAQDFVLGTVVLLGVVAAAVAARRRRPLFAAGVAIFLLALVPFNTALPASSIAAADRYLYLAIPGLALAVLGLGPRLGPVLCCAAVVPFAVLASHRARDFTGSERLWRQSLAQDPDNAVALLNLSVDLYGRAAGAPGEVQDLLERAVLAARYPQHEMRAAYRLALLAEADGRFEAAVRHGLRAAAAADRLGALLGDEPDALRWRVETHLRVARLARRDGQEALARAQFELARSLAPELPIVLCFAAAQLQAEAMDERGEVAPDDPRRARAEALLDRAAATAPALYEVCQARGEWSTAVGEVLDAERHFTAAIEIDPYRAEAHLGRALLYTREGMFAAAEQAARRGLAAGVHDPGLLYHLAIALDGQGRRDDARSYLEAYLRVRPRDRAARSALAAVLAASAMRDLYQLDARALEATARRILELDRSNPKASLILAVAARHEQALVEALALLEQAALDMPGDAEVTQLLAETYRDRGWQLLLREQRREPAMDAFRRFVDIAPPDVPTDAVLTTMRQEWQRQLQDGQTALIDKDLDAAERCFRRCRFLLPEEDGPCLQLGMTLMLRGEAHWPDALESFEAAVLGQIRAGRDPSLAVLYRVRMLELLGRREEARAVGEQYLAEPGPAADEVVLDRIRTALLR